MMADMFKDHFDLTELIPVPKTVVGKALMSVGYFLAAYGVLIANQKSNPQFLIDFLRETFLENKIVMGR